MKRFGVIITTVLLFLLGTSALGYAQSQEQEKPPQQPAEKPPAKKPAKPPAKKPAPQQAEKPAPPQPDKPAQEQAKKPAPQQPDKPAQEQAKKPASQPADKPAQQQAGKPVEPQATKAAPQQASKPAEPQATKAAPQEPQRAQLQVTPERQHEWQQQQQTIWVQHRARSFESEHRTWRQRGGYNGYRIPDTYFVTYYGRNHWFRVYTLPFMVVSGSPRFQYGGYWFSPVEPYPEYWGNNWYETDDVYVEYVDDGYYLFNRRFASRPGISIIISF